MTERDEDLNAEPPYGSTLDGAEDSPDGSQLRLDAPLENDEDNGNAEASEPAKRRKQGAPYGNRNAFKNGSAIVRRSKVRLKKAGRRVRAETYQELLAHLGGEDTATYVQKEIAWEAANDRAILGQMDRSIAFVCKLDKWVWSDPSAIGKLDAIRRPVSDSYIRKLCLLGMDRRSKDVSLQTVLARIANESDGEQQQPGGDG